MPRGRCAAPTSGMPRTATSSRTSAPTRTVPSSAGFATSAVGSAWTCSTSAVAPASTFPASPGRPVRSSASSRTRPWRAGPRRGSRRRGLTNVSIRLAAAQATGLPDSSVDVAHARWAYFFGPGCEPGLAELERVLRPGRHGIPHRHRRDPLDVRAVVPPGLAELRPAGRGAVLAPARLDPGAAHHHVGAPDARGLRGGAAPRVHSRVCRAASSPRTRTGPGWTTPSTCGGVGSERASLRRLPGADQPRGQVPHVDELGLLSRGMRPPRPRCRCSPLASRPWRRGRTGAPRRGRRHTGAASVVGAPPKWVGRCGECSAWGTVAEVGAVRGRTLPAVAGARLPERIAAVDLRQAAARATGVGEFDRVLAAGWCRVPSSSSPVSRASASRRCCSTSPRVPRARAATSSTSALRSRLPRCGCAPSGSGPWPRTCTSPPRPTWRPSSDRSSCSRPTCSSSTPSRPSPAARSKAPRATWLRSARWPQPSSTRRSREALPFCWSGTSPRTARSPAHEFSSISSTWWCSSRASVTPGCGWFAR